MRLGSGLLPPLAGDLLHGKGLRPGQGLHLGQELLPLSPLLGQSHLHLVGLSREVLPFGLLGQEAGLLFDEEVLLPLLFLHGHGKGGLGFPEGQGQGVLLLGKPLGLGVQGLAPFPRPPGLESGPLDAGLGLADPQGLLLLTGHAVLQAGDRLVGHGLAPFLGTPGLFEVEVGGRELVA